MRLGKKLVLGVLLASLCMGGTAQAANVVVGNPLTEPFVSTVIGPPGVVAISAVTEPGAHASSPVSGMIVRWRIAGAQGGPFRLRVMRPLGGPTYLAAGTSAPATPAGLGTETFDTAIPIKAGDLIGIQTTTPQDKLGFGQPAFGLPEYRIWSPIPADGTSADLSAIAHTEPAFNAEVKPAPAVTSLSPASGLGGTAVSIAGTDLDGATSVSFGGIPATAFKVESESKITATAPPAADSGPVDVVVKTNAGSSAVSPGDRFTYPATSTARDPGPSCLVPKLRGKSLTAAKKALKRAGCRIGTVKLRRGATAKTGKVVGQKPGPGKALPLGTKVNLVLG